MHRIFVGKSIGVLAMLVVLAGLVSSNRPSLVDRGAFSGDEAERVAGHRVPELARENESQAILRAHRTRVSVSHLSDRTPPPAWHTQAKAFRSRSVRDARPGDFAPSASGSQPQGPGLANGAAVTPSGVQPIDSTAWTALGPAPGTDPTYGVVTGRINALATDPRTTTAGARCARRRRDRRSVEDNHLLHGHDGRNHCGRIKISSPRRSARSDRPSQSADDLCRDGRYEGNNQFGEGVMKTTDGGATWTLLGASTLGCLLAPRPTPVTRISP